MIEKSYRAGEVLFSEGEPSDYACRLVSGVVDIVKNNNGEAVVLGTARAGDFVGEMGVLQGSPRSATVRAVSALRVEIYPKDEFLKRISEDSETAFRLLTRLSERLGAVSQAYLEAVKSGGRGPKAAGPDREKGPRVPPLRILAGSDRLSRRLPAEGVVVGPLPFVVGRLSKSAATKPGFAVDLALEDAKPYRLSRMHFSINQTSGIYVVRDMHSTLGTDVNGSGLGDPFAVDRAPLRAGDNVVVAGGKGSPFRFRLVVEG